MIWKEVEEGKKKEGGEFSQVLAQGRITATACREVEREEGGKGSLNVLVRRLKEGGGGGGTNYESYLSSRGGEGRKKRRL